MVLRVFSSSLFFLFFISSLLGQKDESLKINEGNVLHYKKIGVRYEGYYIASVSASFRLTNFTFGNFYFNASKEERISLELSSSVEDSIKVKAVGIPNDLFYQMDAYLPPQSVIEWPVKDVLLRNERTSTSRNIGIYGHTGEGLNKLYVPIKYHTNSFQPSSSNPTLKFTATTRLSNIQWKIDEIMQDFVVLRGGRSYYAGQAIIVELPKDLPAGDYTFWIKGKEETQANSIQPKRFKLKL